MTLEEMEAEEESRKLVPPGVCEPCSGKGVPRGPVSPLVYPGEDTEDLPRAIWVEGPHGYVRVVITQDGRQVPAEDWYDEGFGFFD